jgi:hypothetical protein
MKTHDFVESTIRGWIKGGITPSDILIGLNNACVHGEIMNEAGLDVTETNLAQFYAGLDVSLAASKTM